MKIRSDDKFNSLLFRNYPHQDGYEYWQKFVNRLSHIHKSLVADVSDRQHPHLRNNLNLEDVRDVYRGLEEYDFPIYWVKQKLTLDLLQKPSKKRQTWTQIKLPMPAASFFIHEDTLTSSSGSSLLVLSYAQQPDGSIAMFGYAHDAKDDICGRIYKSDVVDHVKAGSEEFVLKTWELLAQLLRFWAKHRESMTAEPVQHHHNERGDHTWNINWIDDKVSKRTEPIGDHTSPKTHWRRGHWRNQPCGLGMKEHKLIWINPILVNSSPE
ncbi:hypothetical protein [Fischerella sp. PCC 9605]|uniref:hypothetical protein n=1 Tax=Fischerella sp. PCC 9605 TaxID=1173024 RepID=UPI00047AB8C8|nr:hypothetical protein [Fischerella sp. PCC 9605]